MELQVTKPVLSKPTSSVCHLLRKNWNDVHVEIRNFKKLKNFERKNVSSQKERNMDV